jgi:outer membrane lipoprotein-sorting protein
MRRNLLAGLVATAVVAAPAVAQTVDDIVAKHVDAMGGLQKIKAVQTLRITGRMAAGPGIEAPFTLEQKRPNLMRMDFTLQGITGSQAFDGKAAWMVMPFGGSPTPQQMSPDDAKLVEEQADMDGPLVDYKAKGHSVELLGKEQVEGADTYKLKVTKKDGTVSVFYLDADSFLAIKQEGKRMMRGTEMEGETVFGDYKEVAGLMYPHSIDSGAKGRPNRQKLTIETIEINIPIDDARFKMPAAK